MNHNSLEKHDVIFVLGPPGSGKGTQCELIQQNFGLVHLSAGELLRKEMHREGSSLSATISKHIHEGTVVPIEITCKIIENAVNEVQSAKGFLIDGFPRNQNNLEGWIREMEAQCRIRFVLYFACDFDTCRTRCFRRDRTDDNEKSFEKRIQTYETETISIQNHFESLGLLRQIASQGTVNEVYLVAENILVTEGYEILQLSASGVSQTSALH